MVVEQAEPTQGLDLSVLRCRKTDIHAVVDRTGSHVKLRYEYPTNNDDIRVASVP